MTIQTNIASHIRPILTTFTYYITFITLGLTMAATGPALPWLAEQTHSRIGQISLIFVASSLGYMIGSLISGKGYDRFPGHHIQTAMLVLMSTMAAMVPVIPWLWLLMLYSFFSGSGRQGSTWAATLYLCGCTVEKLDP